MLKLAFTLIFGLDLELIKRFLVDKAFVFGLLNLREINIGFAKLMIKHNVLFNIIFTRFEPVMAG